MTDALFRVSLPGGSRLALGSVEGGPSELLGASLRLGDLLAAGAPGLAQAMRMGVGERCPPGTPVLAPVDDQEVWCTGVTYERTRDARVHSVPHATLYDALATADRPELFFKAPGWRVRGPGEPIGIRADSGWDMAEPELGLVITAGGAIAGYVIANDMTSRAIERDNPLYLPQAKVYEGSCALGAAIVPAAAVEPPVEIRMVIQRDEAVIFEGRTSTARMVRTLDGLARWLLRALTFPRGVILLTGCGIVPNEGVTLRPGDRVRIEMGPLGVLENAVALVGTGGPTTG